MRGFCAPSGRMLEQEQVARWIVGVAENGSVDEQTGKFLHSSSLAWPSVLAHVRHELSGQGLNGNEVTSLALEIWEETLRSVWKTWRERPSKASRIQNLENYLIGAFHHRLNRYLKRRRLRDSILEFLPPEELAELKSAKSANTDSSVRIHRRIQLEQAYGEMNETMRRAVVASMYGFSWSEIAKRFQIDEQNLIMRVQYAIRKIRQKFAER
jgi:RNA polymerase sigma factor (sigma-70 family)